MAVALPRPAGIAFDLDGTLVDTVDARIDGWLEALAAAGIGATREQIAPMIGIDGRKAAMVPILSRCRSLAFVPVAATIASRGLMPHCV